MGVPVRSGWLLAQDQEEASGFGEAADENSLIGEGGFAHANYDQK